MKKLTDAQSEVFERLWNDGYGTIGFFAHEVFRARNNRDNGARRTLRNMIAVGLFVPDTRTTDAAGNHRYHFTDAVKAAYDAFAKRKWDNEAA